MNKQIQVLVCTLFLIPSLFADCNVKAKGNAVTKPVDSSAPGSECQYPLPVRDGLHPYQYFSMAKIYLSDFRLDHAKKALIKLKQCKPSAENKQLIKIIETGYMPRYPVPKAALKELNRATDMLSVVRMGNRSNFSEVKSIQNQLIKQYPKLEWSYLLLASTGHISSKPEQLKKIIQINPNNVEALYGLAEYYRGKDWTQAYNYAKCVNQIDPNFDGLDLEFFRTAAEGVSKRKTAEKSQKQKPKVISQEQMEAMMKKMMQQSKAASLKMSRKGQERFTMSTPRYVEKSYKFIDKMGKTVLRTGPNVKVGKKFSDGLLVVNSSEDRGSYRSCDLQYWDKEGDLVYSIDYGDSASSTEGLCAVQIDDEMGRSRWGFKNHRGVTVIKPQFSEVIPFQNGMSAVEFTVSRALFMKSKWGFIDKTGKFKVEPIYDHCLPFTEDLAGVSLNGKVGFVNKEGKFVIQPKYDFARPFSEGLANVVRWNSKTRTLANMYIDKTGKVAFSSEQKVPTGKRMKKYINESHFLHPEQYDHQRRERLQYRFSDFHNNLLAQWKLIGPKTWKLGYFGKNGKYAIAPVFDGGEAFSEGLARVKLNRQYYYINTNGKRITSIPYAKATDFSNGMAAVSRDGKRWGYIDRSGKEVIPCIYLEAEPFSEGLAKVGFAK